MFDEYLRGMLYSKFHCGTKGVQPMLEIKSDWVLVFTLLRYGSSDFLIHFENVHGES